MSLKEHGRYDSGVHFAAETPCGCLPAENSRRFVHACKTTENKKYNCAFCILGVYVEKHATIVLHHMPAECARQLKHFIQFQCIFSVLHVTSTDKMKMTLQCNALKSQSVVERKRNDLKKKVKLKEAQKY